MIFDHHESHKHKMAKELLYSWLVLIEEEKRDMLPKGFYAPFGWRTGNYGVHMELPFYETSTHFYWEDGVGLNPERSRNKKGYPVYEQWFDLKVYKGKLLFVPDICIFHKGTPTILVEIVHTSGLSEKKRQKIKDWYGDMPYSLYTIDADNILNTTNKHCNLVFELVEDNNYTPIRYFK